MEALLRHQTVEIGCHGFPVFPLLHAEIQGKHIAGLKLLFQRSSAVREDGAKRAADASAQFGIVRCIFRFSQKSGDLGHDCAGIGIVSRGDPFTLCHPVPDIPLRSTPVAELKEPLPDILPLSEPGERCPEFYCFHVSLHAGIMPLEKLQIPPGPIFCPGNKDTAVAPAGGRHYRGRTAMDRYHCGNSTAPALL